MVVIFFVKLFDNVFFKHKVEEYLARDLFYKKEAIHLDRK